MLALISSEDLATFAGGLTVLLAVGALLACIILRHSVKRTTIALWFYFGSKWVALRYHTVSWRDAMSRAKELARREA